MLRQSKEEYRSESERLIELGADHIHAVVAKSINLGQAVKNNDKRDSAGWRDPHVFEVFALTVHHAFFDFRNFEVLDLLTGQGIT